MTWAQDIAFPVKGINHLPVKHNILRGFNPKICHYVTCVIFLNLDWIKNSFIVYQITIFFKVRTKSDQTTQIQCELTYKIHSHDFVSNKLQLK